MRHTITLTQEQFDALQRGEPVTIQPPKPKPKKWEPQGGEWYIAYNGDVYGAASTDSSKNFGVEYQTEEQAKNARDAMRVHNRLLAYVAEFDPDFVADWSNPNQGKWHVFKDHHSGDWLYDDDITTQRLGVVYMSGLCAAGLVDKLNSGEVVL